jgi:hypothetical protein
MCFAPSLANRRSLFGTLLSLSHLGFKLINTCYMSTARPTIVSVELRRWADAFFGFWRLSASARFGSVISRADEGRKKRHTNAKGHQLAQGIG